MNTAQKYVLALFVGIMAFFVAVPADAAMGSDRLAVEKVGEVMPSLSCIADRIRDLGELAYRNASPSRAKSD